MLLLAASGTLYLLVYYAALFITYIVQYFAIHKKPEIMM